MASATFVLSPLNPFSCHCNMTIPFEISTLNLPSSHMCTHTHMQYESCERYRRMLKLLVLSYFSILSKQKGEKNKLAENYSLCLSSLALMKSLAKVTV